MGIAVNQQTTAMIAIHIIMKERELERESERAKSQVYLCETLHTILLYYQLLKGQNR